jgi:hypothetical protein
MHNLRDIGFLYPRLTFCVIFKYQHEKHEAPHKVRAGYAARGLHQLLREGQRGRGINLHQARISRNPLLDGAAIFGRG